MSAINAEQWKELFKDIGLKPEDMQKWHRLFEQKYPQGHQSFLEWLGLDAENVKRVRKS